MSGGAAQLAQTLPAGWEALDWQRLDDYLERWPIRSPFKRLGYLIETLDLPIPEREERLARWRQIVVPWHRPARTRPRGGEKAYLSRWRVNVEETC